MPDPMTLTTAQIEAASKRAATFIEAMSNEDIFDGYHAFDIVELAQPLAHALLALLAERRQAAELVERWRAEADHRDCVGGTYRGGLRQAADELAARVGGTEHE